METHEERREYPSLPISINELPLEVFIHPSLGNEDVPDNSKLALLGRAVVRLVALVHLYKNQTKVVDLSVSPFYTEAPRFLLT